MGFFDTLLTAIAPERAVKRVAAQTAIRAINSGYSNYGASLHKKSMRGWMWHGGSPKEDIEDNLRVLRERSRDAYMGVPLATGAIKTMRTNVVCGGLTPTPQIDNAFLGISDEEAQKINEQIAREFALWANKPTCDADRIDNFYMLQQLAFTGFLLNGDSWAVLQNKKTPGVPYDLRVRMHRDWFADSFCQPVYEAWFREAVCKGRIKAPGFLTNPAVAAAYMNCNWNGPARTNLNPKDEAEAAQMRVNSGFSTAAQETAQMTGGSYEANMRQRKAEAALKREVDEIAGAQVQQQTAVPQRSGGDPGKSE